LAHESGCGRMGVRIDRFPLYTGAAGSDHNRPYNPNHNRSGRHYEQCHHNDPHSWGVPAAAGY